MNVTIETPIYFKRARAGRKKLAAGKPEPKRPEAPDPVPRVSRLMALAIHFDGLIRQGVVRDYADLARLGGVSRARITQIMNLLNLPPWKQEEILFLDGSGKGRVVMTERIRVAGENPANPCVCAPWRGIRTESGCADAC